MIVFYRAKLNEESAQAFMNLFEQWDLDFQNLREKYVKLVVGITILINMNREALLVLVA